MTCTKVGELTLRQMRQEVTLSEFLRNDKHGPGRLSILAEP